MSEYKQPASVLVVIHTPCLEILLLERQHHPGYWQSVTGSREGDETLPAVAVREVFEETGIDARQYVLCDWKQSHRYEIFPEWRHRYAPGVYENTEHVFSLEIPSRIPVRLAADEHRAMTWLPWQEAAAKCFSWSNRDAILQLPQRLKPA